LEGYIDALELTGIAIGFLLLISLCFILLTLSLHRLARLGRKEKG